MELEGGAAGCCQEGSQGKFNDRALLGSVAVTRMGLSHTMARVKGPARQGKRANESAKREGESGRQAQMLLASPALFIYSCQVAAQSVCYCLLNYQGRVRKLTQLSGITPLPQSRSRQIRLRLSGVLAEIRLTELRGPTQR